MKPRGEYACLRCGIAPFHISAQYRVLLPTKMSAYVPVPQLRKRVKADFRAKGEKRLRTFLARSLSFASFGELLVIDFSQSELTSPRRGTLRPIKFFVEAKRSFRESVFYPVLRKNAYHATVYFLTLLNYSF